MREPRLISVASSPDSGGAWRSRMTAWAESTRLPSPAIFTGLAVGRGIIGKEFAEAALKPV